MVTKMKYPMGANGELSNISIQGKEHDLSTTKSWDEGLLIFIGIVASVGNFLSLLAIIWRTIFQNTSLAIFGHHCFLDFLKSLYCFPYGWRFIFTERESLCTIIGSSYVFLLTTSAYNLLALVVDEKYTVSTNFGTNDRFCVVFGVTFVWFSSFLLNLGVSLIPSNTLYIKDVNNCMFPYGKSESYVMHLLWIFLVTFAIAMAFKHFFSMYRQMAALAKQMKWHAIHKSLSEEAGFSSHASQVRLKSNRSNFQFHCRRILIYISMTTSFALFWYPLFLLTVVDVHFREPKVLYRILTMFAWSHPLLTPLFCVIILRDIRIKERFIRDLSDNCFLLSDTSSRRRRLRRYEIVDKRNDASFGIENDHFSELIDHGSKENANNDINEESNAKGMKIEETLVDMNICEASIDE